MIVILDNFLRSNSSTPRYSSSIFRNQNPFIFVNKVSNHEATATNTMKIICIRFYIISGYKILPYPSQFHLSIRENISPLDILTSISPFHLRTIEKKSLPRKRPTSFAENPTITDFPGLGLFLLRLDLEKYLDEHAAT